MFAKNRSTSPPEIQQLRDIDYIIRKFNSHNNVSKGNENSTADPKRKTKNRTTEFGPVNKMTVKNTTKMPEGTGKALKIPILWKAQTSPTNPKPVRHSGLHSQLTHKLPSGYTEPSMKCDHVVLAWVDDFFRPPYFRDTTSDVE